MSERTDLPWKIRKGPATKQSGPRGTVHIITENDDGEQVNIALINYADEATALRIITAVNNHDALVEALRVFLGGDPGLQISLGGNPNYIDAFLYKVRALLAKIRGEG